MTGQWAFNIDDMEQGLFRTLCEGVTTRIFCGENVMLSVVRVDANSRGTLHSHPEEQWGLVLEGQCVRIQGGEELPMNKGDFWHTPGGVEHTVYTGDTAAVILDVFAPPRDEYKQPGEGFGG